MRVTLLSGAVGVVLIAAGSAWSFAEKTGDDSPAEAKVERIVDAVVRTEAPPLIVHEWGTFTSFSGSDGVKLEFRPLADNDLPGFVRNRLDQAGLSFRKVSISALQRMETPVTYFYTPVERDVSVRVDFPDGLLTEFYPPVRDYAPQIDTSSLENWADVAAQSHVGTAVPLENSMLDWGTVHLIPPHSLRARVEDDELSRRIGQHVERTMLADAGSFTHYSTARETDAAIVQFRQTTIDDNGQVVSGIDYFEKFLFYRGVGNFELPLTLEARDDGDFILTNAGPDTIRSLFLVTVHGEDLWFQQVDGIAAKNTLSLRQSDSESSMDELTTRVVEALKADGLYDREALAMVNTWKQSWFGEEGTRLFYMLPQSATDELLPLRVEPAPDEMIRVLVGRMEIMPPSAEQHILRLVARSAAARERHRETQSEQPFGNPVLEDIITLGRLAEPALVRARSIADVREIQDEAGQLLADLRSWRDAQEAAATP